MRFLIEERFCFLLSSWGGGEVFGNRDKSKFLVDILLFFCGLYWVCLRVFVIGLDILNFYNRVDKIKVFFELKSEK